MVDYDDDRRRGSERFSGLTEGQRYALALVLNLGFVGVLIAGFAYLYTSSFGGASPPEPASAEAAIEDAEPAREPAVRLALPSDSPTEAAEDDPPEVETAALPPPEPREAPRAAAPAPASAAGGPAADEPAVEPDAAETFAALDEELVEEEEPEPVRLAALEPAASEVTGSALEPRPRPAPREAPAAPEPEPEQAAAAPSANLWAAAGQLVADLKGSYPCSQFSLEADSRGEPTVIARVGFTDDIEGVRGRVDRDFEDRSVVEPGLGCTTVVSAGYVALGDSNGRLSMFGRDELTRSIRAVLPGEGACAVIGQVVADQSALRRAMNEQGEEATWVRSGGEPALCEAAADGMWRIVPAGAAPGRRGAALVLGDDVLALEARRAIGSTAGAGAAPAGPPPAAPFASASPLQAPQSQASAFQAPAPQAPAPGPGGLVEVTPLDGPAPVLPADIDASNEGYAVALVFTVGTDGRASELSVVGAGMAGLSVVAAALDVAQASRFPAGPEPYRATYTVRFPSAEFMDLLARLTLATATDRDALPVWDRSPSQADYDRVYPARALRREIEGEVAADCRIGFDGKLACSVAEEKPRGWGFGSAALSLAGLMQAAPRMSDGGPSANENVTLRFEFTAGP